MKKISFKCRKNSFYFYIFKLFFPLSLEEKFKKEAEILDLDLDQFLYKNLLFLRRIAWLTIKELMKEYQGKSYLPYIIISDVPRADCLLFSIYFKNCRKNKNFLFLHKKEEIMDLLTSEDRLFINIENLNHRISRFLSLFDSQYYCTLGCTLFDSNIIALDAYYFYWCLESYLKKKNINCLKSLIMIMIEETIHFFGYKTEILKKAFLNLPDNLNHQEELKFKQKIEKEFGIHHLRDEIFKKVFKEFKNEPLFF